MIKGGARETSLWSEFGGEMIFGASPFFPVVGGWVFGSIIFMPIKNFYQTSVDFDLDDVPTREDPSDYLVHLCQQIQKEVTRIKEALFFFILAVNRSSASFLNLPTSEHRLQHLKRR